MKNEIMYCPVIHTQSNLRENSLFEATQTTPLATTRSHCLTQITATKSRRNQGPVLEQTNKGAGFN